MLNLILKWSHSLLLVTESLSWHLMAKNSLKIWNKSCCIVLKTIQQLACQCSDHTVLSTLHQIGLYGDSPRRKPVWSMCTRKSTNTWFNGALSCGLVKTSQIYMYLVQMVSGVCGGNKISGTMKSVSCLQSSMVVGVSWFGAAWVLKKMGRWSSPKETWMPT